MTKTREMRAKKIRSRMKTMTEMIPVKGQPILAENFMR